MIADGVCCGSQSGAALQTGLSGACGKGQSPAAPELLHSTVMIKLANRDAVQCILIIVPVARITSQELNSELRSIQLHQFFTGGL